jgi:hypothetical protein
VVPQQEAIDFAREAGATYVEVSAQSGSGVDLLFQTAVSLRVKVRSITDKEKLTERTKNGKCCQTLDFNSLCWETV